MMSILGGSLLVLASVEYAAFAAPQSRWSRLGLTAARLAVALGALVLAQACSASINVPLALAVVLAALMLVAQSPMVEALLAPIAALTGLFGGLVPMNDTVIWSSILLAAPMAVVLWGLASLAVHRYERHYVAALSEARALARR